MNLQQSLEILNSMPIIDTDNDGEAMIYIYVENSKENREKVMSLGFSEKDIPFRSDSMNEEPCYCMRCHRQLKSKRGPTCKIKQAEEEFLKNQMTIFDFLENKKHA